MPTVDEVLERARRRLARVTAEQAAAEHAGNAVDDATKSSPEESRSDRGEPVSLPRVKPMITTPSSSALTTMYRPLRSSSSPPISPSMPVGLRLRPHRPELGHRRAHQLID